MRHSYCAISLFGSAISSILLVSPLHAANQTRIAQHQPGDICQLSLPTIDTKVRPKATGYRNEGTTNAYVICSFPSAEGGYLSATAYQLNFYMFDVPGSLHNVSCTGVVGDYPAASNATYVTFNIPVTAAAPNTIALQLEPINFGLEQFPGSFSITCNLPPKTAIGAAYTYSTTNVGN